MQAKMHAYMHFQHMVSTLLPRLWWPQLYCPAYRIAGYQSPRSWAVCSCKAFSLKSPLLKRSRNAEGVERELFARKANPFCILSRHRDGFELLWEIPFNRRLFPSREPIFLTMWAYPLPQQSRQQTQVRQRVVCVHSAGLGSCLLVRVFFFTNPRDTLVTWGLIHCQRFSVGTFVSRKCSPFVLTLNLMFAGYETTPGSITYTKYVYTELTTKKLYSCITLH